jgi:hypothetical protein
MKVNHLDELLGAVLPASTATIGPHKPERRDRLREIAAQPLHAAFHHCRLCLLGVAHGA